MFCLLVQPFPNFALQSEVHSLKLGRFRLKILHETPDVPNLEFIGNSKIREVIKKKLNICCRHYYWRKTPIEFENKSVVMNVDSKVLILKKKTAENNA